MRIKASTNKMIANGRLNHPKDLEIIDVTKANTPMKINKRIAKTKEIIGISLGSK